MQLGGTGVMEARGLYSAGQGGVLVRALLGVSVGQRREQTMLPGSLQVRVVQAGFLPLPKRHRAQLVLNLVAWLKRIQSAIL